MRTRLQHLDLDILRKDYCAAEPFPFFKIDDFLDEQFAKEVVAAYPDYQAARSMGREFNALNERLKVQITDSSKFPSPVRQLSEELSSPEFLRKMEYITGIDNLLGDDLLVGGGMHVTGSGGRLDVHVDFNYIKERQLHRRLNILLYLNDPWEDAWGGRIELWDEAVRNCIQSFKPVFNRCVVFETSEKSYHGVTPVTCPDGVLRRSFAAYYYTKEPPVGWSGAEHTTVFRARPDEVVRKSLLMPADRARGAVTRAARRLKRAVKRAFT